MYFYWSLTRREKSRLRLFESTLLGKIFGPNGNDVRGEWRIQNYEELHNIHYSGDGIKKNEMA